MGATAHRRATTVRPVRRAPKRTMFFGPRTLAGPFLSHNGGSDPMRRRTRAYLAAVCVASGLGVGEAGAQARPASRLAWLAGCWENRGPRNLIEEQWMAPRGGTMLGMARTTRADSLVEFEQLRIVERDDRLVYMAQPSGQSLTEFTSTELGDSVVVFANPAHDFPQRIIYRRIGTDAIQARIEGTMQGKARGIDFPYRRTACPDGLAQPASNR
jgi:hypothetical protein